MKRILKRIAAFAVAVPLAVGIQAAPAQASHPVTLPGCYGAGPAVYCDIKITVGVPAGIGTYQTQFPICAGSCIYVPLTWVTTTPGEPTNVCLSYRTLAGATFSQCYDGASVDPLLQYVYDQINQLRPVVDDTVQRVRDILDNLDPNSVCYTVLRVLARQGIEQYIFTCD